MLPWRSSPPRSLPAPSADAAEVTAVDVRNAVVLRQPFVDERVVGAQQIQHAAILAEDAVEEQLGFLPERLTEIVVEVRKQSHVRRDRREVAQVQPLRGEVVHERARPRVGEHPPRLPLEHGRLVEFAGNRHAQQLIVRNAAPEKERQPRRQLEIAHAIRCVGRHAGRIGFEPEDEMRAHQHARHRQFDAGVEAARPERRRGAGPESRGGAPFLKKRDRPAQVRVRHGSSVGALHQRAEDLSRRAIFFRARRALRLVQTGPSRLAQGRAEQPAPARRISRRRRAVGADDGNRVDGGLDPRMPVEVEVGLVGLACSLLQERRLLQKRHAEVVHARPHRHAHLEVLVRRRVLRLALRRPHREHLRPAPCPRAARPPARRSSPRRARRDRASGESGSRTRRPSGTCSGRRRRRGCRSAARRGASPG